MIPTSGKNLPYDPDIEYPLALAPVYTLPPEPDTNSNTRPESVKVVVATTLLLSVNLISRLPLPLKCRDKVPGSNFSLYLALSTAIT